ncbi:MAG TPA: hypothetical protein PLQ11_06180 [Beijerinckiaceae bacterium]|nr:hypothetical protein [Beijerinckiaceae bacterium]
MRLLSIATGIAALVLGATAVQAQSATYSQSNTLNVAEIDQGAASNALQMQQSGVKNYLFARQVGSTNKARVDQKGTYNGAFLAQYGDDNSATFQQVDGASYVTAASGGRIARSVETSGGVTTYVTTYTNGPISILQAATQPQAFGRLGRR